MSQVTYVGDEPREVAILPDGYLRRIEPDQTFTVPDEFDESYACQPHFFEVKGFPWPPKNYDPEASTEQPLPDEPVSESAEPAKKTTTKGK